MPEPLCVFCRREPADPAWRPFCSERCKMQDLARWADGAYRIPGDPLPEPTDDPKPKTRDLNERQPHDHRQPDGQEVRRHDS